MTKGNKILNDIEAYIFALCMFFSMDPFYIWGFGDSLEYILIIVLVLISFRHLKTANVALIYGFLLSVILIFFSMRTTNLFGVLRMSILSILFFVNKEFLNKCYCSFCIILSAALVPSILEFLFSQIVGRGFVNRGIMPPLNEIKDYTYSKYLFMVSPNIVELFPRFCGYFDEPGVIGTFSGVLLCLNSYNLKSKVNIPIFIAGVVSFSLYFVVISILYLFYSIIVSQKRVFLKLLVVIGVLLGIITFISLKYEDSPVKTLVLDRLKYDEYKGFQGNNRSGRGFDLWYSQYKQSSAYLVGIGKRKSELGINEGGASYKDIIVTQGLIGFLLYMVVVLLWIKSNSVDLKEFTVSSVLFLTVLYQRPFIMRVDYFLLILFLIYSLKNSNQSRLV